MKCSPKLTLFSASDHAINTRVCYLTFGRYNTDHRLKNNFTLLFQIIALMLCCRPNTDLLIRDPKFVRVNADNSLVERLIGFAVVN